MSSPRRTTVDPTTQLQLALDPADAPKETRPPGARSARAPAAKRRSPKAAAGVDAQTIAVAPARSSPQRQLQPAPNFLLTRGLSGPDRGERATPRSRPADHAQGALLFAEDVATMVGMTRKWVYTETRAGRIPHVALGRRYRYRREAIDGWLAQIEQRQA